ncbi:hypothetical protein ACFQYP_47935 [Nonomuraea antimicrobica]
MNLTTCLRAASVITLAALGSAVPASPATAATGAAPPALPDSGAGRATFAYLCVNPKDRDSIPSGPCQSWRLVTADGQRFTVPDALGWEKSKNPDELGESGALAISPDGTRIAYQRAADDAVVVRDLASAQTWTIPYRVPRDSVGSPFTLRFVRDGSGLAITPADTDVPSVTFADVTAGTTRRLPKGWTLLDADPETGRLTLLKPPASRTAEPSAPSTALAAPPSRSRPTPTSTSSGAPSPHATAGPPTWCPSRRPPAVPT